MNRKRVTIVVEVDLDPVPGTFSTKESAEAGVLGILRGSIPHYNPKVLTKPGDMAEVPPEARAMLSEMFDGGPMVFLQRAQALLSQLPPEAVEAITEQTREAFEFHEGPEVPDYYDDGSKE